MRAVLALCLVMFIICAVTQCGANYRKPPFNGSIFGKRGYTENVSAEKAISALCELASDTCQEWFQGLENKK